MEYTNKLEFCIGCHEMRDTVYEEYKHSVHYSNASGVRAICSDCHVPKEWFPKLIRKVKASNELFHKLLGTIDTKEKFEAKRLELAKNVWAEMEANDSHECRNCHSWHAMDFEKQRPKSAKQMKKGMENKETCISCHKGIAHKLPDMSGGYKKMFEDLQALSAQEGAKAEHLTSFATKTLYLDADAAAEGKSAAGRLLAATDVTVVDRQGDALKIRIEGWQQDQVDQIIYALQGKRIFSAALGKPLIPEIQRLETLLDPDTELTWHKVTLEAWTDKTDLVADKQKVWDYGAEMYNASCSVCHSLHSPAHSLANQWIGNLKAMERFIVLDKEQTRFLQKYLQFHAKDTGGAGGHG
ncbi:pentaheme c-type cytochrome TorC [Magnetospira thiophila]